MTSDIASVLKGIEMSGSHFALTCLYAQLTATSDHSLTLPMGQERPGSCWGGEGVHPSEAKEL